MDGRGYAQEPWEQGVPRVAYGVPQGQDRIRSLGDAVVPQVAEYIGRLVIEAADQRGPSAEGLTGRRKEGTNA